MTSSKKPLDLSDNETEELKINKDFSERYERYRSKEVLQQLKDKYGDQIWQSEESEENDEKDSDDSSSGDDSELEDAELFDEKFLRVLGALKSKDESIYNKEKAFYTKDDLIDLDKKRELRKQAKEKSKEESTSTEKMDLNDYHQKLIKEKKGLTAEDEELENPDQQPNTNLNYYQEMKKLKDDLLKAAGDESKIEQDDLIVGKKVIELDDKQIKIDAKTILKIKSKEDECIKKLRKFWKSDNLNENEQFLRDFIINKTYLSDSDQETNEINSSKKIKNYMQEEEERSEDEYDSDDSTHRKLVKTYESTRFHHEQPDADKIKSFPRQIESIRDIALKKKRSDKRSELKERKKQQKEAELRKLRELKRNEIKHKIELLEKTTGTKLTSKLNEIDIDTLVDDTDFDAEKYDQKMAELFNDDYYGIEENDANFEKPKFEYDSEIDDEKYYDELDQGLVANVDDYKGEIVENDSDNKSDDEENSNEEEYDQNVQENESRDKLSKKKKLRLKKKEKLEQKKRDKYLKNKNIGIFEDVIDGQGIRFKYRKTESLNYGLTDEEILLADEKELNRWVSLKKSQQYTDDQQDIEKFDRKGKNLRLKKKILKSLYGDSGDEANTVNGEDDNIQKSNEDHDEKQDNIQQSTSNEHQDEHEIEIRLSGKRKRRRHRKRKNKKQKIE